MNLQYCFFLAFLVLASHSSAYKVGQKYLYNYRVNTLQSLSSRQGASTWSRLNLEVTPLTTNSLKFKISSVTNALGSVPEPTETTDPNYGLTSEFVATYGNPIEFKVNPTDGKAAIGLKKSIASLFTVKKSPGSTSGFEETPIGTCNTIHTVNGLNVTKTRDYGNCTEDMDMVGKKFMSPEFHKCTRSPEHSIPWISRTATFTYSLDDGVIKNCDSLETVSFTLFGHKSSSCIEIKGSLGLESSSAAASSEAPKGLTAVPLSGKSHPKSKEDFDSAVVNLAEPSKYAMWPKLEVADLIKSMETLSNSINAGMSSPSLSADNFTMDFIELQLSLSRLSLSELQSLYTTIKSRTDAVPRIFMDAARFTPSNPVFSFMKTFIKSTDESEKLALRGYLQVVPFRELKVSKALLDGYLELCKQSLGSGLEATCFFSFANILQVHCTDGRNKSPDACNSKISTTYYNKMIATIREIIPAGDSRDMLENGISNNVYNEESLKLLLTRISDPRLQIRRTATVALFGHRLDKTPATSTIQNLLYGKIMNRTEDHVVRIYALLVYMKTAPSLSQFRSLARYLSDPEEDEQVAHYTLSLLGVMKHTVNPCYSGFALLSKYGIREMKAMKGRFRHSAMALSTARIFESYDKEFGFGGSTVLSYIMNKKSLSASVYLEEKMVVNGYTGGHLAVLFETFPGSESNGTKHAAVEGLDDSAAAIVRQLTSIINGARRSPRPTSSVMRFSLMINGRVVDSLDFMQLMRLFQGAGGLTSINRMMIGQQFYNYVSSEHGFTLFNLMVSGSGIFGRIGSMSVEKKPAADVMFQASLSPTFRRDIGAYTLTGVKSPFGSGRSGIMTSIQRTHRLPLNISYVVTKKTAQIKFKLPTEPTDFVWYRMNAYQFNDKSSIGPVRPSLKPLFVDYNGKPENDLVQSKTFWKGFLGNGLRTSTTVNRPRPMDELGYRYRLLEKAIYNDDIRLIRMKFEYGALIVPIDWKMTLLPDPKVSEVTFAFNRSISITGDSRTGEYQMTVLKNSETIISTRVSYSYTTDFLNHYFRLYYNNYLRNIHTCFKGDVFAPKVNYARYSTIGSVSEDKLHFNGSIYFDQSCSKKDIIVKGEFSPSEDQKDPRYIQMYSQSCGKYGLMTNKIPYCAGHHYHMGELRSVKVHITHKDVPSYFWRYLTYIHNKGIQKYANQVRYYGSNEVTDPTITLVSANSTWFAPYKYNVSYKMLGKEEFWNNIPSTGLSWPNSYSLFDFHLYESFHRVLRKPHCYIQKSRVQTFDEYPTNVTIKPGCLKNLVMDCNKGKFAVLFAQDADGNLETIEVLHESPATKLEISPKTNTIKLNGSPVDLASPPESKTIKIKDFGIYKRISLIQQNIKIYFDDVGIYVKATKGDYAQLCGLCGNMNSCHHDDLNPTPFSSSSSSHHHGHQSEYLWLTRDDRNTAKGCVQA